MCVLCAAQGIQHTAGSASARLLLAGASWGGTPELAGWRSGLCVYVCATAAVSSTHVHTQDESVYTRPLVPCVSPRTTTASQANHGKQPSRSNMTTVALLRLYWPQLLLHSFWVIVEIGIRCAACSVRTRLTCQLPHSNSSTTTALRGRVQLTQHTQQQQHYSSSVSVSARTQKVCPTARAHTCVLSRVCRITSRARPQHSVCVYARVLPCLPAQHWVRRLTSPVLLKKYLTWLQDARVAPPGTATWPGWLWALGVAACGMGITLVHHQFFW